MSTKVADSTSAAAAASSVPGTLIEAPSSSSPSDPNVEWLTKRLDAGTVEQIVAQFVNGCKDVKLALEEIEKDEMLSKMAMGTAAVGSGSSADSTMMLGGGSPTVTPPSVLARALSSLSSYTAPPAVYNELATLGHHKFTVCVVGATGCGKSTLVNALIGAPLMPTEHDPGRRLASISCCPTEVHLRPRTRKKEADAVQPEEQEVTIIVHLPPLETVQARLTHVLSLVNRFRNCTTTAPSSATPAAPGSHPSAPSNSNASSSLAQELAQEVMCLTLLQNHLRQHPNVSTIEKVCADVNAASIALHQLRAMAQRGPNQKFYPLSREHMQLGHASSLLRKVEVHLQVPVNSMIPTLSNPICIVDLPGMFDSNEFRSAATSQYIDDPEFQADLFLIAAVADRATAKPEVLETYQSIMAELNSRVVVQLQCCLVFTHIDNVRFASAQKILPDTQVSSEDLDAILSDMAAESDSQHDRSVSRGEPMDTTMSRPPSPVTVPHGIDMEQAESVGAATGAERDLSTNTPHADGDDDVSMESEEDVRKRQLDATLANSARWICAQLPQLADINPQSSSHDIDPFSVEGASTSPTTPDSLSASPSETPSNQQANEGSSSDVFLLDYFGCAALRYCEIYSLADLPAKHNPAPVSPLDVDATGVPDLAKYLNALRQAKHRQNLLESLSLLLDIIEGKMEEVKKSNIPAICLTPQQKSTLQHKGNQFLQALRNSIVQDRLLIRREEIVPTEGELVSLARNLSTYQHGSGSWRYLDNLVADSLRLALYLVSDCRKRFSSSWSEVFDQWKVWSAELFRSYANLLRNLTGDEKLDHASMKALKLVQDATEREASRLRARAPALIHQKVATKLAGEFQFPQGGSGYAKQLYQATKTFVGQRTKAIRDAVLEALDEIATEFQQLAKRQVERLAKAVLDRATIHLQLRQAEVNKAVGHVQQKALEVLGKWQADLYGGIPRTALPKFVATAELDDQFRAAIVNPTRQLVLRPDNVPDSVWRCYQHYQLLETELICDGFYWIPWQMFAPGSQLPTRQGLAQLDYTKPWVCEILVFDREYDTALKAIAKQATDFFQQDQHTRTRVRFLQQLVHDALGGDDSRFDVKRTDARVKLLREQFKSIALPIGGFLSPGSDGTPPTGCCRHRALLFKYLADLSVDYPPSLRSRVVFGETFSRANPQHGGPHGWNVYLDDRAPYLIDTMWEPKTYALALSAEKAATYIRGYPKKAAGTSGTFSNTQTPKFTLKDVDFDESVTPQSHPKVGGQALVWKCWITLDKLRAAGATLSPNQPFVDDKNRVSVAVKLFRHVTPTSQPNETVGSKAFRHELAALAHVSHPNIVHFYGQFVTQLAPFTVGQIQYGPYGVVTEWISNSGSSSCTLAEFQQAAQNSHEVVRMATVWRIAEQLASAMLYLHTSGRVIIHRDLAPDNILWSVDRGLVTLVDFGLARIIGVDGTFQSIEHQVGKLLWRDPLLSTIGPNATMSKEMAIKVDVYAFGLVLLFLVSGRSTREFEENICAGNLRKLIQDIPSRSLSALIQNCMNRHWSARPTFEKIYLSLVQSQFDALARQIALRKTTIKAPAP